MKRSPLQLTLALFTLIAAAKIQWQLPGTSVPFTLQSAVVILISLSFQAKQGSSILGLYLLMGVLGLPIFAGHSAGFDYLSGHRLGYFIGLASTPQLVSLLKKRGPHSSLLRLFQIGCVAHLWTLILGAGRLSLMIGPEKALESGFLPFVIPALIKSGLITLIALWANRATP